MVSVPSLGVLATKVNGKDCPPLVENKMVTLAQLTGAAVVFATFQVIVAVLVPLAFHVVGLFCEVMLKGPLEAATATEVASQSKPLPDGLLSRTVRRKFMVRATCGNISPKVWVLFKISDSCGKVRVGLVVG